MNKTIRSLISVLCAAVLLFIGASALAAPDGQVGAAFAGDCGAGISWTLNSDNGVLSIIGYGDMYDYSRSEPAPWFQFRQLIKRVTVDDRISAIGDYAFFYCSQLANVTGCGGVKSIGDYAFARTGITGASFASKCVTIGDGAFYYCTKLKSADLTKANTIGEEAFEHCAVLDRVTFGSGLRSIGGYSFNGCTKLKGVALSGSGATIGEYAFSRSGVDDPDLSGVKAIEKGAFYHCGDLREVTFPAEVGSVGERAFLSCGKLDTVTFNGSAPRIAGATSDQRSFDSDVQIVYYGGRPGWTDSSWQGYSVLSDGLIGDMNSDGVLTNSDLILIARMNVSLMEATERYSVIADMDGDGQVNNIDIILIARHIVNL